MKKGFTLVELLTVIVLLMIIFFITVYSVLKIINHSKYEMYKRNEEILVNAAKHYLVNNNQLKLNIGEKIFLSYQTIKEENYIDSIFDLTTKKECLPSKIIISKISENKYKYEPGLVCDNYISIDTFDNLDGIGSFETDLSGYNYISAGVKKSKKKNYIGEYSLEIVKTGNNRIIIKKISTNVGDKIYVGIKTMLTSYTSGLPEGLFVYDYINSSSPIGEYDSIIDISKVNSWQTLSTIHRASKTTISVIFGGYSKNNSVMTYYGDDLIILNLTEIYGVGNEKNKNEMIELIDKSRLN